MPTSDPLTMVILFDVEAGEPGEAVREFAAAKEYAAWMGAIATCCPWSTAVGMASL
ncbi:hypothetical protein M2163_000814 [Streptomyces sp. SAI-135]|uniref:hypothetical protein n=1 Tax=unclassified Streptomyces TaxID=2593676 RepID=UPI0024771C23|nr:MULTISPECIES: hypothetical protein [unclassified Streptomyces]MDH6522678.1 hypothetical protein [Streptomyces sp. SAI-090]MDH6554299.1 hypothetical protein [Streptomyces sp. SAI-041]MDH6573562.1 hypothetical protein [Streptomyces sp. SAI-117]MDH6581702.1 hypothetical protein [Streptomyces sp. SAI-133]MDH6613706.1 hypothetical protein [Streptomyces sp. SAI-135]